MTFDTDGFIGGLTAGYSYQINQVVLGVETDISYSDIEGGTLRTVSDWACEGGCNTSVEWFGTLRGRLGYESTGHALRHSRPLLRRRRSQPACSDYGGKDTLVGWTAGAGIEHAFAPNWTVKAEYLYVDLGEVDLADSGLRLWPSHTSTSTLVRIGLNYRF